MGKTESLELGDAPDICYFIEHKETREWWAGQDEATDTPIWTKDPLRAWAFYDGTMASIRAWAYKLGEITEITQHIFYGKD